MWRLHGDVALSKHRLWIEGLPLVEKVADQLVEVLCMDDDFNLPSVLKLLTD